MVGAPVVGVLRLGLAPGEVVAVVLGVVGTHVAGGPQQAARQAEVDIGVVAAAAAARLGGEALLAAVNRHQAVGGVGTHIVGGAGAQAGQAAGEIARACAVGGVAVAQCQVVAGAPAHAVGGNGQAAVGAYRAAAGGGGGGDVGHLGGAHRGYATHRGEGRLLAVRSGLCRGGVGAHIVGGAGAQTGQAAGEAARACAVGGVAVAQRRVRARAPAHATGGDFEAAAVGHRAAAKGTVARNVGHLGGHHNGDATQGGEA